MRFNKIINKFKKVSSKLLIGTVLAFSLLSGEAITITLTTTGTTATNLLLGTNGAVVTGVRVSGVASTVGFALFDSYDASIAQTNQSFTNAVFVSTTCTNIYTNYVGIIETNTYTCVTNRLFVQPATNFAIRASLFIQGSTNTTISAGTPANPYIFIKGLAVTNTGAGTLSIDYFPFR